MEAATGLGVDQGVLVSFAGGKVYMFKSPHHGWLGHGAGPDTHFPYDSFWIQAPAHSSDMAQALGPSSSAVFPGS